MPDVPNKSDFEKAYAGSPPWEVGRPQAAFVAAADAIVGDVLDVGCGTGDLALFLSKAGRTVVGVDYLEAPIERAKEKAAGVAGVEFRVLDARELRTLGKTFDAAVDSGCFHVFSDADRAAYVRELYAVLRPGGRFFVLCFSEMEPGVHGPRRVTEAEIRAAFADGWEIESIAPTRFEVNAESRLKFSPGGPHARFATVRRIGDGSIRKG